MNPAHRQHRDGPPSGFDFTGRIRALSTDMVRRLPDLAHIDMDRVAVGFSQTRRSGPQGIYATLTPLRFVGGGLHTFRRGRQWGVQRLFDVAGREMLYILRFYLPRFLDLAFEQKLTTVAHELWHIGPAFDGDLRRFNGRCYAHSPSRRKFDATAEQLARRWLDSRPPESLYDFLRLDYRTLVERHGRVFGIRVTTPKLRLIG